MTQEKITEPIRKNKSKLQLIDQKFGRLLVKTEAGWDKYGQSMWKCQCECGQYVIVRGSCLKSGNTQSCGCLRKERIRESLTKHGMSKTATYSSWLHMLDRCINPNNDHYYNYGGRGITVSEQWRDSFIAFFQDMGLRPNGLTIERKNNELGYYKENCCWATRTEQARNQRLNKTNKTGVAGVWWDKKTRNYQVHIGVHGKTRRIGVFNNLETAVTARQQAELKYWPKQNQSL